MRDNIIYLITYLQKYVFLPTEHKMVYACYLIIHGFP